MKTENLCETYPNAEDLQVMTNEYLSSPIEEQDPVSDLLFQIAIHIRLKQIAKSLISIKGQAEVDSLLEALSRIREKLAKVDTMELLDAFNFIVENSPGFSQKAFLTLIREEMKGLDVKAKQIMQNNVFENVPANGLI